MLLSIVIPTKNEEKNLPRLLHSIREQSFKDYEVIVADATSTDQTRIIAKEFGAHVVEGGLPGPGRNRGATIAQGEVIAFFDADVILPHPDFLKDSLEEMEQRKLDVATCRVHAYKGTFIDHAMHGAYNTYARLTEKILPHAAGFCMFARRHTHVRIKGFDEDILLAEDHDYARRAADAGLRFGILRKHAIPVSMRRMRKEGYAKIAAKYIYTELHMVTRGPMKKDTMPFEYEFAKFKKEDEEKETEV